MSGYRHNAYPMSNLDDLRLARACAAGEGGAWERLVSLVLPPLSRVAARTLARFGLPGGGGEVEDVVQTALGELLVRDRATLKAYDGRVPLVSYLSVVVVRQAQRQAGKRRLLPLEALEEDPAAQQPREAMEVREEVARLLEAMDILPPQERLASRLLARGASNAEIAAVLKIGEGQVRTVLSRARAKLRVKLGEIGESR
jgi:RNA polymerase sigma factor (sigma-70 family)